MPNDKWKRMTWEGIAELSKANGLPAWKRNDSNTATIKVRRVVLIESLKALGVEPQEVAQ